MEYLGSRFLFYFPSDHENKSSANILRKSCVNEVKTNSVDGSQVMEVVVKPGAEVTLNDLRVEVSEEGQLTVYVERHATGQSGNKERKVIKTYSLPETAILDSISSKMANDGTLSISVPISGGRGSMRWQQSRLECNRWSLFYSCSKFSFFFFLFSNDLQQFRRLTSSLILIVLKTKLRFQNGQYLTPLLEKTAQCFCFY